MKNLYKITTRYEENANWAAYFVVGDDGHTAAAYLQAQVLNRTKKGKLTKGRKEVVDEIALIAPIEYTA